MFHAFFLCFLGFHCLNFDKFRSLLQAYLSTPPHRFFKFPAHIFFAPSLQSERLEQAINFVTQAHSSFTDQQKLRLCSRYTR